MAIIECSPSWYNSVEGCQSRAAWHAKWAEKDREAVKVLERHLDGIDNDAIEHAILTLEASAVQMEESAEFFIERAKTLAK